MSDGPAIVQRPEAHCFEAVVDGQRAELAYQLRGQVLWLTHTEVPPALEGRGIAGWLVGTALTWAREQGLKVVPSCSYAAAYMRRHPEQADLLA